MSQDAIKQWKAKLPELCAGFSHRDIFNCDETSMFLRALPQKSRIPSGSEQSGVKVSKDRFSVLVCAYALGEKIKLLVIGKSNKPHSFPRYNSDFERHVTYRSNSKAGMTSEILVEFLNKLNNKIKL